MSKLLLNERPLLVMPLLATKIGLNEAIVLQQIHYWNEINKKADNNYRDGYYWTFNSYEEWNKQFPFWSIRTIQRIIKRLENLKLIVIGNYNKLQIDRTKWYRIDIKVLQALETSPFGQNGTINMTEWHDHLDKMALPLPEINTKINSKTNNIHLSSKDGYIKYYLKTFKRYLGKEHMRIKADDIEYIEDIIESLKVEDIDYDIWVEEVTNHFDNLPKSNNGNIIAFLSISKRIFGVDV